MASQEEMDPIRKKAKKYDNYTFPGPNYEESMGIPWDIDQTF
jgi:hypothetical protein